MLMDHGDDSQELLGFTKNHQKLFSCDNEGQMFISDVDDN